MSEATDQPTDQPTASRRTVLCCAAAVLATGAATAVAGCSSASSESKEFAAGGPVELGAEADVPVGGGKVYREEKIVVTQPQAGTYKAFSAKCTHAGCVVDEVKGGVISCPCHSSKFAIADGAVQDGPAPKPLPEYRVAVKDGKFQVTKG
ncbi:Rieske (2Fe-2S) protein [Kitasatospora camelliae]|uniref:Cytochrome bc1 complex Rieske iron-sulfur subunit n=1 Tax=Kitasatospora camelliae TaxID=3156397 RepID=A0AAU8K0V9_9ACTN